MATLKVVSTPQQPKLTVTNQPNQPTLSPKVVTKPIQPTLAPKVVNNPVQPNLAPQIGQPQLPTINVDNSPRFINLGEIVKMKYPGQYDDLESGQLGKMVATQYPGVYDDLITPATQTETPKKGMGLGDVAKELLKFTASFGLAPNEISKGIAKGVGNTATSLESLSQKALDKVTNTITGINPSVPTSQEVFGDKLKPTNTAQKIGYGTEQLAEFFIPAGAFSKLGKSVELGIEGLNYGSKATKALQLGAKAGIGATETAGITAAQGGNKSDVKTAAGLGAFLSVASKGLELILKSVPETAWSSILKRTPTDAIKNPNLPEQATKTGLTGITRQSIANKAQTAIQSIEISLDDLLSKSEGKINTAKVAGYLADLRNSYAAIPGESTSVKAIDDIASELYSSFKQGQSMTVLEANQLKRNIYQVIAKSYGKGMFELPAKTEAQKLVASGLKREIESVIPEVKSLNEKQAVYLQIKKALDKTIARSEGKGIAGTGVGLYDLLLGGIGTGAGAMAGNPLLGIGAIALKKTAESPLVLSSTAKLLDYFNSLSPTKKLLFYQALKGLTVESSRSINSAFQKKAK